MADGIGRRIKRRALQWLLTQINTEMVRQNSSHVVLGEGATLTPQAVVMNLREDAACITVGANSYIQGRLMTHAHGGRIEIGEWCCVGARSEIWSMSSVSIGNRVLISHDVNIHDHTAHSKDPMERHAHFMKIQKSGHPRDAADLKGTRSEPIIIEDDAWISFGATILMGVRIGKGSIIGAGALVTKDVPPNYLYYCRPDAVMVPIEP
jgi:maltose O-acetyltransferase